MSDWESDLKNCRKGDFVCSDLGWGRVDAVLSDGVIVTTGNVTITVELNGSSCREAVAPVVFTRPPQWLMELAGPKPKPVVCEMCGKENADFQRLDDVLMCQDCLDLLSKFNRLKADKESGEQTGNRFLV